MVVAAAFAFYQGWKIHHGQHAWLAYGLGTLALALAFWHFSRRAPQRREFR